MKKILFVLLISSLSFGACTSTDILRTVEDVLGGTGGGVTQTEIVKGLKQALHFGISNGAQKVSLKDGFFKNAKIKIPFPPEVNKVANTLRDIGAGKLVDNVVLSLNRAAEDASKSAKDIFVTAIKQMTFQDAMGILKGEQDAATQFLKRTTTPQLTSAFKPVISRSLDKVDATKHWSDIFTRYNKIPFVKKQVDTDLTGYVTGKALDGLFVMVAQEEAKIRKDPLARSTDLLKKVFKLQDK